MRPPVRTRSAMSFGMPRRMASASGPDIAVSSVAPVASSMAPGSTLRAMTTVHLLHAGYAGDRVGSSVVLVRDADATIIVDPGMVARRSLILDPLRELGVAPEAVSHVFLSHHHPD